jgi:DNA-binding MarR family transcriptional regulator/GNAT superfamily N-acetyltransferase
MATSLARPHVHDVRRFNRFYTNRIGALEAGFLQTRFSLTEARILYELAQHADATATALKDELSLDGGYLSRVLSSFERRKLLRKRRSAEDGRKVLLSLTDKGQREFARLNGASHAEIERLLGKLGREDRDRLVGSMRSIESLLGAPAEHRAPYILRPPQPGDMGWVVQRHGVLYDQEYGWDATFEALVAEIVASFVRGFDPKRERCWIAEREGDNVGCVFLVKHPERERVAKLRLLLVEPSARGLGIGKRLVSECSRFARRAGYRTITLWTNSVLDAARHLYEVEGYKLVAKESHSSFGHDLVGQTWELAL